jgi:hypothetical protein
LRRASEIIRNDLDKLTGTTLQHVATVATPHMRAILAAITADFPAQSDAMFTTAIALYLSVLLAELAPERRAREIDHINLFLTQAHPAQLSLCVADLASFVRRADARRITGEDIRDGDSTCCGTITRTSIPPRCSCRSLHCAKPSGQELSAALPLIEVQGGRDARST